ncbi:MAG TPA: hypothetical protein ENI85_08710 [Deltaproteobacteria bacterium]|nr:hypothetical protein [Deltaproteobacteria bacterium]
MIRLKRSGLAAPRFDSGRAVRLLVGMWALTFLLVDGTATAQTDGASPTWEDYLDYAYVFSSADADALSARLDGYAAEIGLPLDAWIKRTMEDLEATGGEDSGQTRRRAIAWLLEYLATREPAHLDHAVDTIDAFSDPNSRHEDRYWYHYIHAHRALERGSDTDFDKHVLGLWMDVVVPLESPFETLQNLSLSQSANSGFVSALPYVFENVARLVLIRSQEMGMGHGLDPLAAVVRLLADQRVGAFPDVIPVEASVRDYLERIIARLEGPESDGGSLTFTLVLFEATKLHDVSRGLLASEGLSEKTIAAIRAAGSAYGRAIDLAQTPSGQAAVYTRVLRQMGEVHAAKQRLGVDPDVEIPFTIEGALQVYGILHDARNGDWRHQGFRTSGYESYLESMRGLWEEIQEATLNSADYYLSRALDDPARASELTRNAARLYSRYISHFERYATVDSTDFVPDSAYFAAYEAARGYADAFIAYGIANPSPAEIQQAVERYKLAIRAFPFDRSLWPALTTALERRGRANDFLAIARPIAEVTAGSRAAASWVAQNGAGSETIEVFRRALGDELVLMYMGFADANGLAELEQSLVELKARRAELSRELEALAMRRDTSASEALPASPDGAADESEGRVRFGSTESRQIARQLEDGGRQLAKLDKQISARARALPLFRAVVESEDLAPALRSQRQHPVHTLLRRLYHEG